MRGALRIVTNARRVAMDASCAARRAARVADDEIVWFWRPWAGAKFAGDDPANDGDYEVTDTGKSTKISR